MDGQIESIQPFSDEEITSKQRSVEAPESLENQGIKILDPFHTPNCQTSSIQNMGGTCELVTIGHNPAKLSLTRDR